MSDKVGKIQEALRQQGFDPGDVDGVWGRKTIAAVRAFQAAKGLEVDGVVGPQTAGALLGAGSGGGAMTSGPLVWFDEARRLFGTKEKPGRGSNPDILEWAADLDIHYPSDDIPWCGLFVAHCIGSTLTQEPLPKNPLSARAWEKSGRSVEPQLGAVLVFWRKSKDSGLGHVGFYKGEDEHAYHVLGGNQSDSVSVARVGKDRLLGARWPATAASLSSTPVHLAAGTSSFSFNEA
jgi:uncharacterized protein (TIGR02594 family)